jgi:hypothetical protein
MYIFPRALESSRKQSGMNPQPVSREEKVMGIRQKCRSYGLLHGCFKMALATPANDVFNSP